MTRLKRLGLLLAFAVLTIPSVVGAQALILTLRQQLAVQSWLGSSGFAEQWITKCVSTLPLSAATFTRVMCDSSVPALKISTNGGAYTTFASFSGAGLTLNQLLLGGGGSAIVPLGSLGTTTTLLHGNAAGAPTFGAVVDADITPAYSGVGTCTNQFITVLTRNAAPTCTTDVLASAQHANQGTTTTVLHGNAAGNPSFGAVVLTTDISGILGVGNGGTGTSTTFTQGSVVFAGASGIYTQDNGNFFYDGTNHNLLLGGATAGTNGAKLLALGLSTAPTTSPANVAQVYGGQINGAGTAGVIIRDEVASTMQFGGYNAGSAQFLLTASGGNQVYFAYDTGSTRMLVGTNQSFPVAITPNNTLALFLNDSRNVGFSGVSTFGTNAARVLGLSTSSTAPTTAPASMIQLWAANRAGANTGSLFARTEDSGITESVLATTIQASDTTERTTTSTSTVDLSTLTVNIPAGDGFIVAGMVRKTAGAAASVSIGIKVNGTQIISNFAVAAAGTNQAEFGSFAWGTESSFGVSRDTNYTNGPLVVARVGPSGAAVTGYVSSTTFAANLPTAAITSITITGLTGNAAVTLAVKNITVYRIARQ